MIVKNPKFVISAVSPKQYPETDMLEIAFAGRSNVGKSSLINALLGRKNIARKSATPGKTRQINYYNLDDEILFVDLPGYGYAKVSKGEKNLWANVIENYLNIRPQLYLIILIVDIRHEPTQDDVKMAQWLKKSGVNFIVAASKKDKLKKTQIKPGLDIIGKTLGLEPSSIVAFSSVDKDGVKSLWDEIDKYIVEE